MSDEFDSKLLFDEDVRSFNDFIFSKTQNHKKLSILALVGSGLSASSGIYPYKNANNMWRNYSVIDLATPDAFDLHPDLVWLFYALRRHIALQASPNNGHKLLSELSNLDSYFNFLIITQNLDGLHKRAGTNPSKLLEFHGSLFKLRCTNFDCNYKSENFIDPLTPSLDTSKYIDVDDPLPKIEKLSQLPLCPKCGKNSQSLLRPGVVWFGETLPLYLIDSADEFIIENGVDLLLVIGTSHSIWPTSSYIDLVKNEGGKIAVFNTIRDLEIEKIAPDTKVWQFIGDCAQTLPAVFNPIIEKLSKV